jgi:hypothetical protein
MRLLVAAVIWVGAVAGAIGVSTTVAHSIHTSSTSASSSDGGSSSSSGGGSSSSSGGGSSSGATQDPSSVTATDSASLFRTANFTRVLAAARSHLGAGAKIDNFVVYPGYLSVTAVKGGTDVNFYVSTNGTLNTSSGGSPGSTTLFSLSKVTAGGPAALAARIAAAGHLPESKLHYMVAMSDPISGKFRWLVYPVQGTAVEYFETQGASLYEYRTNSQTGPQRIPG